MRFERDMPLADVRQLFVEAGYRTPTAFHVQDDRTVQVKFEAIDEQQKLALESRITEQLGAFEDLSFRTIGPAVGAEVGRAAIVAVAIASLLILLYIWFVFRQVSHPFRYGACAVIALIHDVLVTLSFVCIMNLIAGWELDALFLTAILTVIGYSVNDTIVVFDRIRENFRRYRGEGMALLTNRSIVETFQRSLGTVITTLLTLVAVLVLGGPTVRQFAAVLVVGIISGMYSSIFNASPLLVAWDEGSLLHRERSSATPVDGQAALA
ncbi:MAG: protein translocase subunit SecF [Chloroflexi bacterium]|nr:MAG: protein translocase subunit SecF [Chloroflexota bacterium]